MPIVPQKIKNLFHRIIHSDSSARDVADGLGIGMFITFLPIVGIQMYVAFFFTWLFRKNKLVAVLSVWITNPFTIVPIYLFNYKVGELLYHPNVNYSELVTALENWDFEALTSMSLDLLLVLWIGSAIVGLVAAIVSRWVCLKYYDRLKSRVVKNQKKDLKEIADDVE